MSNARPMDPLRRMAVYAKQRGASMLTFTPTPAQTRRGIKKALRIRRP